MSKDHLLVRVILAVCTLVGPGVAQIQPEVTVEGGKLIGTTEFFEESEFLENKTIDVFKGIPFAQPPVGPLRFKPPVTKEPWDGTYNATYFRDSCVQGVVPGDSVPPLPSVDEDCLYLNIYAPRPAVEGGAAVMVWIHGGGFVFGSSVQYYIQPMVAFGDVIVVSINYRLNVFGFMTTGDEVVPGNAGLLDQVFALEWIKKNIAAFGGDSERITIFGESAGSASVSLLVLSQMSRGLFQQAIMQSGTAYSPWAFTDGKRDRLRRQAFDMGKRLGCSALDSAALVNCLRQQDAMAVLNASQEVWATNVSPPVVVDGTFLDDTPANLYATGRYNHAPILLGTTRDEGTLFVSINAFFGPGAQEEPPFLTKEDFDRALSAEVANYFYGNSEASNALLMDAIKQQYVDWSQADNQTANYLKSYVEYFGDSAFVSGTDQVARDHAQSGDDVFMYQMTRVNEFESTPPWMGATHGADLWYVFGMPFSPPFRPYMDQYRDDVALSVKFMEFWTTFAKTGNPSLGSQNSPSDPSLDFWPKFTIPELEFKELDLNLTNKRALKSRECHFWNTFVFQLRTMMADADDAGLEWKQSFYNWKYTDMAEWRAQFAKYKEEL
ncbi:cholinesterase 1-like [Acanthaster planci]|uniref:Carboxylic ester hydrolase n=1 Tax=Acanthaster planci TaxID=133434 RepID=A0A8B7Z7U1_ACAPL|nr:cholinesterase 1-like [Acanthaster planci]